MAGPRRIGEVLSLSIDSLGEGISSDGKKCKTLKFYCEKGTGYVEQPILSSMVPYVEEAFKRAEEASRYGRWLADWLERFPNKFPRHSSCPDVAEDKPLRDREIKAALGHLTLKATLNQFSYPTIKYATLNDLVKKTGYKKSAITYVLNLREKDKGRIPLAERQKVVSLAKDLKVGPFAPMSVREFAEKYGYLVSKVSRVLNGKSNIVAKGTKEKVIELAKELKVGPYQEEITINTIKDLAKEIGHPVKKVRLILDRYNTGKEEFRQKVLEKAKELKVGPFRPKFATLDDLAKKLNCSVSNIQIVLNSPIKPCDPFSLKILEMAEEMKVGPFSEPWPTINDLVSLLESSSSSINRALKSDPQYDKEYKEVLELARKMKVGPFREPQKPKMSYSDIADRLNISVGTVGLAFTNRDLSIKIGEEEAEILFNAQKEEVGPFNQHISIKEFSKRINVKFSRVTTILSTHEVCEKEVRNTIIKAAEELRYNPFEYPPVTLRTLNNYIRSKLPVYFPRIYQNIPTKYSNALFCRVLNQGSKIGLTKCVVQVPSTSLQWQVHVNGLGRRETIETIWQRFGIIRKDGTKPYLNSHSIRHYLDSIAAESGLSQMERAWWAGRANPNQNDVYDHRTDEHFLEKAKKLKLANSYNMDADSVLDKINRQLPVTPEEVDIAAATALSTPIGYCARSIHQLPCQIANDCINCTKLFCIKGESQKKEQYLRELMILTEKRLSNAFEAEDDGLSGASRYVIHQQKTLERLRQMNFMQKSIEIPSGSILQIRQEDTSPMAIAIKKLEEQDAISTKEDSLALKKSGLMKRRRSK